MTNPYEVFGTNPSATAEEIKATYRRLAKERYPDHGGTQEAFALLSAANSILSDPEKRRSYDAL